MNFLILKTIVESTILNFNTQNPAEKISENNVSIVNMSQKGIDLMIRTTSGKDINVHAEVNFMNGALPNNFSVTENQSNVGKVNDNDVTRIHQALKNTTNISDLFGDAE